MYFYYLPFLFTKSTEERKSTAARSKEPRIQLIDITDEGDENRSPISAPALRDFIEKEYPEYSELISDEVHFYCSRPSDY